MKSLVKNREGIVYVWVAALLLICMYSIAWFTLVLPAFTVMDSVETAREWTGSEQQVFNLARLVLQWHPLIMIFGLTIWALVNSAKKEYQTYEY